MLVYQRVVTWNLWWLGDLPILRNLLIWVCLKMENGPLNPILGKMIPRWLGDCLLTKPTCDDHVSSRLCFTKFEPMAGKLIDMISQAIVSSKFSSELILQLPSVWFVLFCSYGFVWKCWVYSQWNSHLIGIMIINHWVQGYTIFRHTHICSICWTQVSFWVKSLLCQVVKAQWSQLSTVGPPPQASPTVTFTNRRLDLEPLQICEDHRDLGKIGKWYPLNSSKDMLVTLDFTSNCEKTSMVFVCGFKVWNPQVLELGRFFFWWFVIVMQGLVANRPTLAAEDQEGHGDALHRATGEVWLGEDLHQGALRALRGARRNAGWLLWLGWFELLKAGFQNRCQKHIWIWYEYFKNIFWIFYEYYEWFDGKGNAVTQDLQLLLVMCFLFWLHAFAGRVAKDSVGGKWKGLRCVHHRLRSLLSPWTKIHWTNFSFEFSQSWIKFWVSIWVSIVRSGRNSTASLVNFLLRIFCISWVLSPLWIGLSHFHCGEDFSVALRDAAGCVYDPILV